MATAPPLDRDYVTITLGSDLGRQAAAAVQVTNAQTTVGRGETLLSSFMGSTERDRVCATCSQGDRWCPGHAGVLNLNTPLQHPLTVTDTRAWLLITCHRCGDLLTRPETLARVRMLARKRRLPEAASANPAPGTACQKCSAVVPKIERSSDDNYSFFVTAGDAAARGVRAGALRRRLFPGEIHGILSRIPPDAVALLAPDPDQHPRNLLVRSVTVPAVTVRPQTRIPSLPSSENVGQLTSYLTALVTNNRLIPPDLGERYDEELAAPIMALNDAYYSLLKGSGVRAGGKGSLRVLAASGPPSSLAGRLSRKQGRIRQDTLAGRSWLISRSTISGNPDLTPDEVGIPLLFARAFKVEEIVTVANLQRLTAIFLQREPGGYPRCRSVRRRRTGRRELVENIPPDVLLEPGDVVMRDAINGDLALFNRQPTLERSSIAAHRVVVMHDPRQTTFQMNVVTCSLYNADFN